MLRLFNVYIPASVAALLASEACLLFTCFAVAAAIRLDTDLEVFFLYGGGLLATWVVVSSIILGLYFQDLYGQLRVRSRLLLVQQVSVSLGIAFLIQAILNYVQPELLLPRWMMFIGSGLALVCVPLWRMFFGSIVATTFATQKVVFVGSNEAALALARAFDQKPEIGYHCAGFITENQSSGKAGEERILGSVTDVKRIAQEAVADHIVVGLTDRRVPLPADDLVELRVEGIPIQSAGALYEATFGRVPVRELRTADLVFPSGVSPSPSNLRLQAIYSWVIAAVLLVLTLPIMVILALLVKLTSEGPIFERHTLVGKDNRIFRLSRFRVTRVGKGRRDFTQFGMWLRRLSLDALPQLVAVLQGDLSIVGPRPHRPEFAQILNEKIPFYRQRTCVKPGVTGWAQINGIHEDALTRLEYDFYYIKRLSFSLDLYVILSKIKSVILGRG